MKRIFLTQGQFATIDDSDYKWLSQYKWYAIWMPEVKSFYAARKNRDIKGKQYMVYMAREILGLKRGDKRQADHINHNTLDNRKSELRIVTNQQNHFNQKNPKGYYCPRARGYVARIRLNGKNIHLGCFPTAEEAHNAYLKAKVKYHKI